MTNEELARAVERVAQMATDLEEFEYLNPPRAQASCDLRALLSERAELLASVERMRGALEPFALAADNMDGDEPDSLFIYDSPESAMIDYADLRRARAALTTGEGK